MRTRSANGSSRVVTALCALLLALTSSHCDTSDGSRAASTPSDAGAAGAADAELDDAAGGSTKKASDVNAGGEGGASAASVATTGEGGAAGDAGDALPQAGDGETSSGPSAAMNGCLEADYVDQRAATEARTIAVGKVGLAFTPKCMTVARGQTVRWVGNLSAHPLAAGNPQDADAGSADSPILDTESGSSVQFTFGAAGVFPYYCRIHAFGSGQGMAGVVVVR